MKREYKEAELEIVEIERADIITDSNETGKIIDEG